MAANGEPDGGRDYTKCYCASVIIGYKQNYIFQMPSSRAGSYFFLDEKVSKKSRLLKISCQNYSSKSSATKLAAVS